MYKLTTSNDMRIAFLGSFRCIRRLIKCVMSCFMSGWMKWSTNCEILFEGHPLAETIGQEKGSRFCDFFLFE